MVAAVAFGLLVCTVVPLGCRPAVLEPGRQVERRLRGGVAHDHEIEVPAGHYLQVEVEQIGVDVVLALSSPSGETLHEVDSPTTLYGPEALSWVARTGGDHRLRIRAARAEAASGRYVLRLVALRPARRADARRLDAERRFTEAGRLHWQNMASSLRRAEEAYTEAAARFAAVGDVRMATYARLNRVEIQSELGDPAEVLDAHLEVVDAFRRLGDRAGEAEAVGALAYLHELLGRKQQALSLWREVLPLRRALGDVVGEANVLHNTAAVYASMGDASAARDYYDRALDLMRAADDRYGEAYTLTNLAGLYRAAGENDRAMASLERALLLRTQVDDPRGAVRTLIEIGAVHEADGAIDQALATFEEARRRAHDVAAPSTEARLLIRIGGGRSRRGDDAGARAAFEEALAISREVGDPIHEATARIGLARLEHTAGAHAAAAALADEALARVEALRLRVTGHRLRARYLASVRGYYELAIDIALARHREEPDAGHAARAFQVAERFRARSLLDGLREARVDIRQGVDGTLLARERALQAELNDVAERQLVGIDRRGDDSTADVRPLLDRKVRQLREVQAEIRHRSPHYAALTQPEPLTLEAVQEQVLDPETLLLTYVLGAEGSHLWAVARGRTTVHPLPPRGEIEDAARAVFALATARNREVRFETAAERASRVARADDAWHGAALTLGTLLLEPVRARLADVRRVAIVADGGLHYVPFTALPVAGEGRLGARLEVVHLPSASVLATLRRERQGRSSTRGRLAMIADPVYDATDPRVRGASDGAATRVARLVARDRSRVRGEAASGPRFARLAHARDEADSILRLVPPGRSWRALGFAADRAQVLARGLDDFGMIHFAAHAEIDETHPELSGIVLSLVDETGGEVDGFLRLHDIYNLRLDAELVVLSACRTAIGEEVAGEGLVGLARGFMYAGVPRVVAALWSVDDEATAALMVAFYEAMIEDRLAPAAALTAAQRRMASTPHWQAPYFWAGFVLQGEWR